MSTISLLDPRVRTRRSERRRAIQQFRTLAARPDTRLGHILIAALIGQLERVRRNPRAPGWWKEQAFRALIQRHYAVDGKVRNTIKSMKAELHKPKDAPKTGWFEHVKGFARKLTGR